MNNQALGQVEKFTEDINQIISLSWFDNPSVQNLLDVVVSIIAEEYIDVAQQNPDLFKKMEVIK